MTLSTLRTRLERATEAEQAEVLEMAFYVFCQKPISAHIPKGDWNNWILFRYRFGQMLLCKAYTDAALLIMREVLPGWEWGLLSAKMMNTCALGSPNSEQPSHYGKNTTAMPIAIIAAICAAKGDGDA